MAYEIREADEEIALADLIRWMSAQRGPPGREPHVWRHRAVRKYLEGLGLSFLQKSARCKLTFYLSELRQHAPLLAERFRPDGESPESAVSEA